LWCVNLRLSVRQAVVLFWIAAAVVLPARADAQAVSGPRIFVSVGVGQQSTPSEFTDQFQTPLHAEQAQFDLRYRPKLGRLTDIGGGVRAWRQLWVGVAVGAATSNHGVTVTGRLPNPFRFDALRAIDGAEDNLSRAERGVHLQLMWRINPVNRLDVAVFGGPSWTTVRQDLVETVNFSEAYPYDTATFTGVALREVSASAVGVNVGADVTYRVMRHVGVGAQARWTKASVDLDVAPGRRVATSAGGSQASAGVRLMF
jgi:hypothetical protein